MSDPGMSVVLAGDIYSDGRGVFAIGDPDPNPRMRQAGLRSWIQVPLGDPRNPRGSLSLRSTKPHIYSLGDVEFLERLASVLTPVLQNAKLYAQTKNDAETLSELTVSLQESAERRQILAEIGKTVSSTADVAEIFDEFARLSKKLVDFKAVSYTDIDPVGGTMTRRYSFGHDVPVGQVDVPLELTGTVAERAMQARHAIVVRADDENPISKIARHVSKSADQEIKESVCVPLLSRGQVFGCFYFSSDQPDVFDVRKIELIELITDQVSGAIANARSSESRMQAEKERLQAELRERELASLNEQKSEFLSTVSHELKTPLTSLVAFADILSKNVNSNLSERQLQQLQVMQRSSRRLDVLINDLVDVSQIDGGTLKISKQKFLVEELVEEIRLSFEPILEPKRQTSAVCVNAEGVVLVADRHRIAQMLTNLISNSSKYSPAGANISVSVGVVDGRLEIVVSDDGIGMDEDTLANMFTPFFRADDEKTQSEAGTGLGLAIVKKIVDLHGGVIAANSELGVGTTVRVELPGALDGDSAGAAEMPEVTKTVFGFSD